MRINSVNNNHRVSFGQIKIDKSIKKYAYDETKKIIGLNAYELAKITDNVFLKLSMKETGSYMNGHKLQKTGRVL